MDHAALVSGPERLGDAPDQIHALGRGQLAAREPLTDALAIEPLHREPHLAFGRASVGDVANDAGMPQRGEDPHLAREPLRPVERGVP